MKKMLSIKKIFAVSIVIVILASFTVSLNAAGNGWKYPVTNVCAGPSPVWTTHEFNCTCGGHTFSHKGVDINAKAGAHIIAAKAGTIVEVFTGCKGSHLTGSGCTCGSSYGNYVKISHGNNLYTLYAHLSSVLVSNGSSVAQGQAIGLAGTTGDSTGPHLHFEVRSGGGAYANAVNPKTYLDGSHWHSLSKGKCTSCGALLGDVNNDGRINAQDTLLVSRFVSGINDAIDMTLADINRDGKVDSTDLNAIKQIIVGSYNW